MTAGQSNLNLALFRAEGKAADEREATFRGMGLYVHITPDPEYPFTQFHVKREGETFDEQLFYSHLALGKILTEYEFSDVLEIGSRYGTAARALAFAGKKVTTVEIQKDEFSTDFSGDYATIDFGRTFDAIWCSHVLEHQRNAGKFCDKMFDDLKDGGVLAVTVPSALSPMIIGHCNIFTPLHLVYHLICAGFDCSEASVRQYDWQISCIVKKKSNGLRRIPFGSEWLGPHSRLGVVPNLRRFFPLEVQPTFSQAGHAWGEVERINW